MLKIITLNLNGIRSAARKGCFAWLEEQQADVICVQELKAQAADLQEMHVLDHYHPYFCYAEQKGYSGVGIYSRYVAIDLGGIWIASLYMPSGTSGDHRQQIKYDFLDQYAHYLRELSNEYVICGDFNIAHQPIDLKNWRANQKNSGFLPEERQWMDKLFGELRFVDAFRLINQEADQYTWLSHRGRAWEKNVGWRIDYHLITPGLKLTVKSAFIYKNQRFSDHAPLGMEYDIIKSNF